jgi:alpha-tubulin suppressor-like RCC1 family protein
VLRENDDHEELKEFALGARHAVCLSQQAQQKMLYGWGANNENQLGLLEKDEKDVKKIEKIHPIKKINELLKTNKNKHENKHVPRDADE